MDFWAGVALGSGIHLEIVGDTQLLKPYPWSSKTYGYMVQLNEGLAIQTMACAYRASLGYPVSFKAADELTEEDFKRMSQIKGAVVSGVEGPPTHVDRREPDLFPAEEPGLFPAEDAAPALEEAVA